MAVSPLDDSTSGGSWWSLPDPQAGSRPCGGGSAARPVHRRTGLHLLAGPPQPNATTATTAELTRLFDLLVTRYRYVVVDCSSRLDDTTRLIADLSNMVLMPQNKALAVVPFAPQEMA